MGVYLPIKDYSAMQGPAPSGFHVPSKDEWVALIAILKTTFGLENKATTMGTYLKMPTAGNRSNSNSNVSKVGSNGNYWFSTSSYSGYASYLFFNSFNINPQGIVSRPYGCSVRCFKNSPTIPTSSWTTLYDGSSVATGAGVFYNATDGLISVSGDGQTWYTIQDKNLGATTVYNQGDTLTDANCGYFFQWGNNYGFPHSGAVTTSSTKVDASNYGPGNYYSSSTFITASAGADWSSVKNDNLWGGVTGLMPTSLKNAYIGEYQEGYKYLRWTITANRNNINVTQMSEFEICDNSGTKMARPSGTTITGSIIGPSGETVDKLIDGSTSTKYCPNGSLPIVITITLGAAIDLSVYNKYKRYTANDESGRDPKSWAIEVSRDGSNWDTVSTVTNASIPKTRYALAGTWDITVN